MEGPFQAYVREVGDLLAVVVLMDRAAASGVEVLDVLNAPCGSQ